MAKPIKGRARRQRCPFAGARRRVLPASVVTRSAALVVVTLLAGSCVTVEVQPEPDAVLDPQGGEPASPTADQAESAPSTTIQPDPEPPVTASTAPPTTETSEEPPPATADAVTTTTDPGSSATTGPLPGEPFDFGPAEGADLVVVGVDHDDVLNVRDVPAGEIIATLDLLPSTVGLLDVSDARTGEIVASLYSWEGGIVATGRTRKLPTTIWHEVRVAGMTGWASGAYLAQLGVTDDATAEIIGVLGERPVADTMLDLGLLVAQVLASDEPPSRIVVAVAPNVFEGVADMTVDVVNVGDDSVLGFRLDLFAHPAQDWMQEDPGPYTLRGVERTVLCYSSRGVSAEGLCN